MSRFDPGEGPEDDPKAAHDRAQLEHAKHDHAPIEVLDAEDVAAAKSDIDDPTQQETQP